MESNQTWQGKSHGGRIGNEIFAILMRYCGLNAAYALLIFVAFYFSFLKRGIYKTSAAYLRRAVNPKPFTMPFHVYRHTFSFGKSLIDKWAYFYGIGGIEIDNSANTLINAAIENQKGMVAISAHLGGWEISASLLKKNFGREVYILGTNSEDADIQKALEKNRKEEKIETIQTDTLSILNAYKLLKSGAIVAVLGDRNMGGRTHSVKFFGADVEIPLGPYALARSADVPAFQIHCVRTASRKYKLIAFDRLNAAALSDEDQARLYAQNLERLVKDYPYQWANFYDFFGKNP